MPASNSRDGPGSERNPHPSASPFAAIGLFAALAVALSTEHAVGQIRPTIQGVIQGSDGRLNFSVRCSEERVLTLEESRDLTAWTSVDFVAPLGSAAEFNAPLPDSPRFYRIRSDPCPLVSDTNYHGWAGSLALNNGVAEVVVVPAVNRIMQFRLLRLSDGPFWENRSMDGWAPSATSWNTPGSFGGDKIWPAPQSLWGWPPPRAYDSLSSTAHVARGAVTLNSPVDTTYGRCVRRIELHPYEPLLRVVSRIEKPAGTANTLSVWTITQVKDPGSIFVPVPSPSVFPNGYQPLGQGLPLNFAITNGLLSFSRDPANARKLGNDAGALVWVGTDCVLLMESPRVPDVPKTGYPDSGCSVEVYTNPNTAPYVELETLGPLHALPPGSATELTNVYRLFPRTCPSPVEEAERVLGRR